MRAPIARSLRGLSPTGINKL